MNSRVFPKLQPNTKRGVINYCQICSKAFGVLNVEHQCKRCLRAVCKQCGKTKRDVYKLGFVKTPHRLCQICLKQSDFVRDYVTNNQLKFGQDSTVGRKWVLKVGGNEDEDEDEERDREQSQFYQAGFTYQIFCQVWDSYNYSLRQLIGLLTFQNPQKQIYKQINIVYKSLQHPSSLCQTIPLIIFLLCFVSPDSCTKILKYLYKISQIVVQKKQLFQAYVKILKVQDAEIKKITPYLQSRLDCFVRQFSVNVLAVESTVFLFGRLVEKGRIEDLYIMFAVAVEECIKGLVREKQDKIQADMELVKNFKLDKFMQKYRIASTAKISHLLKQKPTPKQPVSESPTKTQFSDAISNKTRSIWDQSLKQRTSNQQRKTQKPLLLPRISQSQQFDDYHSQCFECEKNIKKIEDLQSKLKLKEREIQNLNFMVSFNGQGSQASRKGSDEAYYKADRYPPEGSLYNELSQQKRENIILKSRIQQFQQSNKILKNTLSSSPQWSPSLYSGPSSHKNTALNEEESISIIESLKQKLQTKSRQYQQVIKKNKLLNYQIEEMERQYSIKKLSDNIGTREELSRKLEQLSQKVVSQQEQKLKIANQLFQANQIIKMLGAQVPKGSRISQMGEESKLLTVKTNPGKKECKIF